MDTTLVESSSEVAERVITETARRDDVDPLELPPLYDAIDPDALEALFAPKMDGTRRTGSIQFPYAGYDVTLEFDGDGSPTVTID